MSDHDEVSIRLRPLQDSPWLTHDIGFGTSIVSIADEVGKFPEGLTITGVRLNGVEQPHRVVDSVTVIVAPRILQQGGYLTILCKVPPSPVEALKRARRYIPSPDDSYGLQRAVRSHALPVHSSSGQRG